MPLQVSYRQQNFIQYNHLPLPPQPSPRSPSCKHTQAYSFYPWHTQIITMYTPLEYILTIISLLNLCTAGVIYMIDRKQGEATINSGKYFKSFKICMTMSIMFGIASMCLMITNLKRWRRATKCNRYKWMIEPLFIFLHNSPPEYGDVFHIYTYKSTKTVSAYFAWIELHANGLVRLLSFCFFCFFVAKYEENKEVVHS